MRRSGPTTPQAESSPIAAPVETYGPATLYTAADYTHFRHNSTLLKGHVFHFRRAAHSESDDAFSCADCLRVADRLDLNPHVVQQVRVVNGLIADDPEAKHICLTSSNGTLQLREIVERHSQSPGMSYTAKDCDDFQYGPVTTGERGQVSYVSNMYERRMTFRLRGKSKQVPDVDEYFCTACRKVDGKYTCLVCVKDGRFVAVDPDYSFSGHVCINAKKQAAEEEEEQCTRATTRQRLSRPIGATFAPKRKPSKSPGTSAPFAKKPQRGPPASTASTVAKLPIKQLARLPPSGAKAQDFGKAHFVNGEVEWKSRVHKGKTIRFVCHMPSPVGPVVYYRCEPCRELC
ncbi:hypothetical protein AAVH_36877, partial [Aphelenchoides avenae]